MMTFIITILTNLAVRLGMMVAVTDHGKRVMLIGSIYAAMQKRGLWQHISIEDLNERLELAEVTAAFTLPRLLCDAIWGQEFLEQTIVKLSQGTTESGVFPRAEAQLLGQEFADSAPKWLRFDRRTMVKEVTDLFTDVAPVV